MTGSADVQPHTEPTDDEPKMRTEMGWRERALLDTLREALASGDLKVEIAQEGDKAGIFERLLDNAVGLDETDRQAAREDNERLSALFDSARASENLGVVS